MGIKCSSQKFSCETCTSLLHSPPPFQLCFLVSSFVISDFTVILSNEIQGDRVKGGVDN